MSRAIIITFVALAVVALAPLAIGEKGYILIALNDYTIEGTITAFVIMTLFASVLLYLVYRVIRYLLSLYGTTRFKWASRAESRKLSSLQTGIWQFINHDFNGVQKSLAKSPVPNGWDNLAAALLARSALEVDKKESARVQLERVSAEDTSNIAQMLVACGQPQLAKNTMVQIMQNKKASAHELANLAEYLIAQQDWQQLSGQLTRFEKKHALSNSQWDDLFERYFAALDKSSLTNAFSSLSKSLKEKAENHFLINLVAFAPEDAEKHLVKLLKGHKYQAVWQVLEKSLQTKLPELQKMVQTGLKKRPDDQSLLLTLAYIAHAQNDHELACKVFNKVLTQDNAQQHWRIAADSFAQIRQTDQALSLYQRYA